MITELSKLHMEEGIENLHNKRLNTALYYFQEALIINNKQWEALNLQGLCLYTFGEFKRAERLWQKSILINPKEENRAYQYVESITKSEFTYLYDIYNKALKYAKDGNLKKADKMLKNETFHDYKIIPFINLKGLISFALGKKIDAISLWKEALLINEEDKDALRYITNSFDERNEYKSFYTKFFDIFRKS